MAPPSEALPAPPLAEARAEVATRPMEEDLEERWIFRKQGMVYGPFSGRDIANKIVAGELDETCEIADEDGAWRTLRESKEFWPVVSRARARLQAEKARLAAEQALRRETLLKRLKVGGAAAGGIFVIVSLAALGYSLVGGEGPPAAGSGGGSFAAAPAVEDDLLGTGTPPPATGPAPAVATAGPAPPGVAPSPAGAKKTAPAAPAEARRKKRSSKRRNAKRRRSAARKVAAAGKSAPEFKDTASAAEKKPEELVTDFSRDESMAVPREEIYQVIAEKQRGLVRCIQAEAKRTSYFGGEFTVDFGIKASGVVGKVSLDNADDASPKLLACLRAELARWKFPRFRGATFQVSLPFNITR